MKKIIFLIAIIVFIGCKEEAPTEQKVDLNKEYTLEELENDPNWVEVTDIDTLKRPCIVSDVIQFGRIANNKDELRVLFSESIKQNPEFSDNNNCINSDSMNIDFNNRTLILYYIDWLRSNVKRKIFKNDKLQKYLYKAELRYLKSITEPKFLETITIPKINSNYTFVFDSVIVNKD